MTTLTQIKIETYWNVNAGMQAWTGLLATIKIETYWNVNLYEVTLNNLNIN